MGRKEVDLRQILRGDAPIEGLVGGQTQGSGREKGGGIGVKNACPS